MGRYKVVTVLGITGGVGTGKSTTLEYLHRKYGALIIECDQVGRDLQKKGGACYGPMASLFGEKGLLPDGEIDRKEVARQIYSDPEKKKKLERIVLPAVKEKVKNTIEEADKSGRKCLIVVESAILIDDGYDRLCDEIWYVFASEEKRRERLKKSRNYSDQRIDSMFRAQRSEASFREHCQYSIDNTSDIVQNTLEQLDEGIRKHFPEYAV